jgi:hypothetical protein
MRKECEQSGVQRVQKQNRIPIDTPRDIPNTVSGMKEKRTLSYADRLKDPRWQKKRLKVFERDDWTCRECGRQDRTLNVHHKFYIRGLWNPWEYSSEWLETLCSDCHERREAATVLIHKSLLPATTGELMLWAKRIGREIKQPRKRLANQAALMPPVPAFIPPVDGKTVWDQMRAAANGLIALQELRNA